MKTSNIFTRTFVTGFGPGAAVRRFVASRPRLAVAAVLVLSVAWGSNPAGPGGSGSSGGSGGSGGTGGTGGTSRTISALIEGVPFTASAVGTKSGNPDVLLVGGTTLVGASGTTLGFGAPLAVGTYSIAVGSGLNANMTILPAGVGYLAFQTLGSGSVTIATLTSTGATGTFNFVMQSTTGGPAKTVTNGVFNVTF